MQKTGRRCDDQAHTWSLDGIIKMDDSMILYNRLINMDKGVVVICLT